MTSKNRDIGVFGISFGISMGIPKSLGLSWDSYGIPKVIGIVLGFLWDFPKLLGLLSWDFDVYSGLELFGYTKEITEPQNSGKGKPRYLKRSQVNTNDKCST